MNKMTAYQIKEAAEAVTTVASLDNTIDHILSCRVETLRKYGGDVRNSIGRNILCQFVDDELGSIVSSAIVDSLKARRRKIVEANTFVEFPAEPD